MINIDSLSAEMAGVLYSGDDMPSDALKILHEHNVELAEQEIEDFKEEVLRWIDLVKQNINVLHLTTVDTQDYEAQMRINNIIQERLANFFDEVSVEFKSSLDEPDSDESDNESMSEAEDISQMHHDDKENEPRFFTAPKSRVDRRRADSPSPSPSMLSFR